MVQTRSGGCPESVDFVHVVNCGGAWVSGNLLDNGCDVNRLLPQRQRLFARKRLRHLGEICKRVVRHCRVYGGCREFRKVQKWVGWHYFTLNSFSCFMSSPARLRREGVQSPAAAVLRSSMASRISFAASAFLYFVGSNSR